MPDPKPQPRINPVKDRALTLAVEATARFRNGAASTVEIARIFEKYLTEEARDA
jgi:hypothetical protein